jgi:predicted NBD/HSP70 family sugar kinase
MFIVLDIGGTQMRIACSDADGTISEVESVPTPQKYSEAVATIQKLITARAHGGSITAISIGVAGVVPQGTTILVRSPHLTDWEGHDLAVDIKTAGSTPIFVHNDVALGGLGEVRYGDVPDSKIVAYIAVGTGVGGVRIVNGAIDTAAIGFEIGHQLLSHEGSPIEFEQLVSGSALFKRYGKTALALMYDPVWEQVTKDFSVGLYNTILHWSPDTVVLGGSVCSPGGIEVENVAKSLAAINTVLPSLPHITYATLAGVSGLKGACAIANDLLA